MLLVPHQTSPEKVAIVYWTSHANGAELSRGRDASSHSTDECIRCSHIWKNPGHSVSPSLYVAHRLRVVSDRHFHLGVEVASAD